MTKPAVVVEPPPDAPGILHVDTEAGKFGPAPTHDVGHLAGDSPSGSPAPSRSTTNTHDDTVRQLAYALWEARGRPHDSSDIDWLAAEREVSGRRDGTSGRTESTQVSEGLGLMRTSAKDLGEDGVTNPKDGRGPLRASDDQGCDSLPGASVLRAGTE